MSYSLRLYSLWNSPGQNTGVGSLSILQGISPIQGSNPGLLDCRQIISLLSHKGSPRILEWVTYPFYSSLLHCRWILYQLSYQESCCYCQVTSVMSDSMRPQRRQPTRLPSPWDSPGKNTGVGCHFLPQCMKVKSEREVAQSCLTLRDLMDCSLPGFSIHGIFQAKVLEWRR